MIGQHNGQRSKVQALMERGHKGVEIARVLNISPSLVYNHVHGIKTRKRRYKSAENRAKVQEAMDRGLGISATAKATGLPRSTVQHHRRSIKKEQQQCQQNLTPSDSGSSILLGKE